MRLIKAVRVYFNYFEITSMKLDTLLFSKTNIASGSKYISDCISLITWKWKL
jgi:hypothetical protein